MVGRIGMNKGRLTSLIRLSYLAPEIVGALLAGRHPIELTPAQLRDWAKICRMTGTNSAVPSASPPKPPDEHSKRENGLSIIRRIRMTEDAPSGADFTGDCGEDWK
jgi:hypothetical protein